MSSTPQAPATSREPRREPTHNFAFVMNLSGMGNAQSYALAPGHELRRATEEEILIIKSAINTLVHSGFFMTTNPWEQRPASNGQRMEAIPKEEWRYFVIAFQGNNDTLRQLEAAFQISPVELDVGMTFLYDPNVVPGAARMFHPDRLYQSLAAGVFTDPFFEASVDDLEAIATIHSQMQRHNNARLDVRRLATQVGDLKALPHRTPLRFLGYFAVLESLLTHPPKPSDPYDSITRQVKKKISLLNARFQRTLDYTPFGSDLPETIWTKMYKYRSLLAHGEFPTFDADLQVLRNHDTALRLLRDTVKAILRQALIEPLLLLDLREC